LSFSFNHTSSVFITCPFKTSTLCAVEVEKLGYKVDQIKDNAITIQATLKDCIKLNMNLRTASKVLWLLFEGKASNAEELYRLVQTYDWELLMTVDGYFSIQSFTQNSTINNTLFTNLKVKDAIADFFIKKYNKRPDSGPENRGLQLYIYWIDDQVRIYIDTSGDTLARHGYRKIPLKAPLQENLAAAIILATNWDLKSPFINPMCGSGTLAIEAAMMMTNRVPGLIKKDYAFQRLKGYSDEWYRDEQIACRMAVSHDVLSPVIASDLSADAIRSAKINASLAGLDTKIKFQQCPFEETIIPEEKGIIIINPPYGERIGEEQDLKLLYKKIGDFFKTRCKGYKGYVFTGNPELAKYIGLKPSKKTPFFNAKIECRLLAFDIYEGSKKQFT
jgi:putative N6-adenine-specific DNA methylase